MRENNYYFLFIQSSIANIEKYMLNIIFYFCIDSNYSNITKYIGPLKWTYLSYRFNKSNFINIDDHSKIKYVSKSRYFYEYKIF